MSLLLVDRGMVGRVHDGWNGKVDRKELRPKLKKCLFVCSCRLC